MTSQVWAFDPFVVRDIRVEGLQRTEAGSVFGYLPIQVGDRVTEASAAEAIKTLFGTGFFKDVRLAVDGDVLIVTVEERPAIASVDISGSKEFEPEVLKKALRDTGLAEARIFDRALLDRAEQEIKRQYLSRSKYSVKITSTVTPLERNRVGIAMAIEEGGRCPHRADPDHRQPRLQRIATARPDQADHADLAVLVHQDGSVFPRETGRGS